MREAIALSLAPLTEEEQLRQAMAVSLQAPPTPATAAPADEDAELQAALALSMGLPPPGQPSPPTAAAAVSHMCIDETNEPEPEPAAEALAQLVFGADASPTVLRQWHSQGIRLGAAAEGAADGGTLPFGAGLVQEHGGPCAVLSAAQAFLLRRLLFDPEPTRPTAQPAWRAEAPAALLCPPAALAAEALLSGLADMLWGAALGGQGADADADAGAAPPAPGDASCVVALLPPELLPFEGSAAELQACLPRVTRRMHARGWRLGARGCRLGARGCRPDARCCRLGACISYGTPYGPQACVLRERVTARSWAETRDALCARRDALSAPHGSVSFLYSALLSRGLARFGREPHLR